MEGFPAHIKNGETQSVQSCTEHSRGAASEAEQALKDVGLSRCGYLAGLLHDCGKFKPSFGEYILAASRGKNVRRGSVIHTFAGARYILERFHSKNTNYLSYGDITAEMLSYAVGAHHGLFDCVNEDGENGFLHRLLKIPEGDDEAVHNFLLFCADEAELGVLFKSAKGEIADFFRKICVVCHSDEELAFFAGLAVRLITSAVIEGDRRNTSEFMTGAKPRQEADCDLWERLLKNMEEKLKKLPKDTAINEARFEISRLCRNVAQKAPGIYRLNVPTGGGKTLSSLRFALAHAAKHGKTHIIFTSPLLSILEQNSAVIHKYINDDSVILEHHSNVLNEGKTERELERYELLSEDWSSPIIITTLVQLLNTMFDGKTASVRRFHTLTNSVIIIDEVQTVPSKLLTLFNLTISFLSEVCGATIILCSATQPSLEKTSHPITSEVCELINLSNDIKNVFKRTQIEFSGEFKTVEIADFAAKKLESASSLLIICNKKSEASEIFCQMKNEEANVFHLSASMCIAHRNHTLEKIYESLKSNKKTVCVSTQVIEAGVDISFECVIRLAAGMDSVIQAAGRCNRNGESEQFGQVYIVNAADENLTRLTDIAVAKQATRQLIFEYREAPERFDFDLSSEKSVNYYYNRLYSFQREKGALCHDYPLNNGISVFSLLSENGHFIKTDESAKMSFYINQAFASAGKYFEVFDNNSTDVIVPWGEGKEIMNRLMTERAEYDMEYFRGLLNKAKPYTVSLYSYQKKMLEEQGGLLMLAGGTVLGLDEAFYNNFTGLQINSKEVYEGCNTLIW